MKAKPLKTSIGKEFALKILEKQAEEKALAAERCIRGETTLKCALNQLENSLTIAINEFNATINDACPLSKNDLQLTIDEEQERYVTISLAAETMSCEIASRERSGQTPKLSAKYGLVQVEDEDWTVCYSYEHGKYHNAECIVRQTFNLIFHGRENAFTTCCSK